MTGAYKDENDMNRLEYIEKDGIKIGLVGITRYTTVCLCLKTVL